ERQDVLDAAAHARGRARGEVHCDRRAVGRVVQRIGAAADVANVAIDPRAVGEDEGVVARAAGQVLDVREGDAGAAADVAGVSSGNVVYGGGSRADQRGIRSAAHDDQGGGRVSAQHVHDIHGVARAGVEGGGRAVAGGVGVLDGEGVGAAAQDDVH